MEAVEVSELGSWFDGGEELVELHGDRHIASDLELLLSKRLEIERKRLRSDHKWTLWLELTLHDSPSSCSVFPLGS